MDCAVSKARGFSLTELMVSLLIGSVIMVALLRLLAAASSTLHTRDTIAEMQERARYALAALEPDLQMAGYYGLSNRGSDFAFLNNGDAAGALPPSALRPTAPAVVAPGASAHSCGSNFALDLVRPIEADNNRYLLGRNRSTDCAPRGGARNGADTLTIRRANSAAAMPDAGRLQLLVDRLDDGKRWLLSDARLPSGFVLSDGLRELHDLEVRSYYIANDSVGQDGTPALRVKSLTRIAGRANFVDTEIMPGIEDMQVQFQTASGYVEPDALPVTATVRALQVWLLVRASTPETGYRDPRDYNYANRAVSLSADERRYRRLLVTRVIALRNAPTE
jgi:prepilin-type N-terminal cleavage/methylation domain-containing protein